MNAIKGKQNHILWQIYVTLVHFISVYLVRSVCASKEKTS